MQRLGRTGRKRSGCCVALCTAGAELTKFRRAMAAHKVISTSLKRDIRSFQMYRWVLVTLVRCDVYWCLCV